MSYWLKCFWWALRAPASDTDAAFWWHCEVVYRTEQLRDRFRPHSEICTDCGQPWKRWWRTYGDHSDCLPF